MQQPVSCNTGKWVEKSHHKDKEGPVKSACLSCRTKKAKCDGGRPVCGQVSNSSTRTAPRRRSEAGRQRQTRLSRPQGQLIFDSVIRPTVGGDGGHRDHGHPRESHASIADRAYSASGRISNASTSSPSVAVRARRKSVSTPIAVRLCPTLQFADVGSRTAPTARRVPQEAR